MFEKITVEQMVANALDRADSSGVDNQAELF